MHNIFLPVNSGNNNPQTKGLSGLTIGGLSWVILALNAAGQLHVGLSGLLGLIFLFLLLGLIGCYWYTASVHLLAQWMVSPQTSHRVPFQPWFVVLQGLWPTILLGPAVSTQRWWPSVGILFTLGILVGTGFTLVLAIRRTYVLSWTQASLCFGVTVILGGLATLGGLGWPMMLFLGAKNFGIIPILSQSTLLG
ncbi:MAG: hypothetical protein HC852_13855 [Acaryochloridaceae cyanobacterium RU_4_10]|jgi:hypothetical protein|nr:hypothetical protein [Acaryochloridaceae cyanobacterium RU_4_10]